jgi:D-apionolactonase
MDANMSDQTIVLPFDVPLLPTRQLRLGNLNCIYEYGKIRYVNWGTTEIARNIYFAVRNENWQTASYDIRNEKIERVQNGYLITYTSVHSFLAPVYKADIRIQIDDGHILFEVNGEALSSFLRNRIGVCVHHPLTELIGKVITITKPDGGKYTAILPSVISPHQPLLNIHEMQYEARDNTIVHFGFSGDVFETEDQRNWSDASFKTYSTPLDLPFPVRTNEGERMRQTVDLSVVANRDLSGKSKASDEDEKISMPSLGYCRSKFYRLNAADLALLQNVTFHHYVVPLSFSDPDWSKELVAAIDEAVQLGAKVRLIVFFTDHWLTEVSELIKSIEREISVVQSVLPMHVEYKITPHSLVTTVYERLKNSFPHLEIGYGTHDCFAEVNRNPPADIPFDFISFPVNPQVHASDTRSLIENLQSQSHLIKTANTFAQSKKIFVTPVTFKAASASLNSEFDHRQQTSFGAFWTVASLAQLAEADSITFYEVKGPNGIIADSSTTKQPPVYEVLKTLNDFKPKWVIRKSDGLPFVNGITFENEYGNRLKFEIGSSVDVNTNFY